MSAASTMTVIPGALRPPAPGPREDPVARIWALLDEEFVTEMASDPERRVLAPPENHRLLIRPVCVVAGCSTTAPKSSRICGSCRRRLEAEGLGDDQVALLGPPPRGSQSPHRCLAADCQREQLSGPSGLCHAHLEQRQSLKVALETFLVHPEVAPLAACGSCLVAAWTRQRRHPDGRYCAAHQIRLRRERRRDPRLDEERWRLIEPAIGVGGEVSLRGLEPLGEGRIVTMATRRHTPEQVIRKLREADRMLNEGADLAEGATGSRHGWTYLRGSGQLRSVASTWGAPPVRTWQRSSSKVTSRT